MKNLPLKSLAALAAASSTWVAGCGPKAPEPPQNAVGNSAQAPLAPRPRPEDKPETSDTKFTFDTKAQQLRPGKVGLWTIKVASAKDGVGVGGFDVARGRLMHLVVVKKDLSWFNRLNPTFNGNGTFSVLAALPEPGEYVLFADYTPKEGGHEKAQHTITIDGVGPKAKSLVPDVMRGAWMMKEAASYPEGQPGKKGGASYKVALMPMPRAIKAGAESTLHFQIRDAKGDPVKDLQFYLGAQGLCSVVREGASKYLGLESSGQGAVVGPDVLFKVTFPQPGMYKVWGQFLRQGRVISAPFVLRVA